VHPCAVDGQSHVPEKNLEGRTERAVETRAYSFHPPLSLSLGLLSLFSLTCIPSDPAILRGWKRRSELREARGRTERSYSPIISINFHRRSPLYCCDANCLLGIFTTIFLL